MWPASASDPTGLALLRAAVANPAEETPRLVLADWLQEQGEEEVAGVLRESMRAWGGVHFSAAACKRWHPLDSCISGWIGTSVSSTRAAADLAGNQWATALSVGSRSEAAVRPVARLPNLVRLQLY